MWSRHARKFGRMLSTAEPRLATIGLHSARKQQMSTLGCLRVELAHPSNPKHHLSLAPNLLSPQLRRFGEWSTLRLGHKDRFAKQVPVYIEHQVQAFQQPGCMYASSSEKQVISVYTDANPLHGFGCVWGKKWVTGHWSKKCQKEHKTNTYFLETYAILCAIEAFGPEWAGCCVHLFCDHLPVVTSFTKKSKNGKASPLFEKIMAKAQSFEIDLELKSLCGKDKKDDSRHQAADALSRGQLQTFRKWLPDADTMATELPSHLPMIKHDPK